MNIVPVLYNFSINAVLMYSADGISIDLVASAYLST